MKLRMPMIPASFFGIVLGLVGLGDCWRAAHLAWGTSEAISTTIMIVAAVVWVVLLVLYVAKWVVRSDLALAEFHHPVQSCSIALLGVSTLLMAYLIDGRSHALAVILLGVGTVGELIYGCIFTSRQWRGGNDTATITPAIYLPTVASNLVAAFSAAYLGYRVLAILLLGAGILSWLMIESQIGFRMAFTPGMEPPLRPTVGILLAPPAVACEAYLFITGGTTGPPPNAFALGLAGYALFIFLVLVRHARWVSAQPFAVSYWAFSFGITSLAFDLILFHLRGMGGFLDWLSVAAFGVANVVIAVLAVGTVIQLLRRTLLPPSPMASSPVAATTPH